MDDMTQNTVNHQNSSNTCLLDTVYLFTHKKNDQFYVRTLVMVI